jgi:hypothetical protein
MSKRMCDLGGIDDWFDLSPRGSAADLAQSLIPTLGTEQFFELWCTVTDRSTARPRWRPERHPTTGPDRSLSTALYVA